MNDTATQSRTDDPIINQVLQDSLPQLRNLFEGTFGEEMESERMLEFMASVQVYAGVCMRTALLKAEEQ